MRDARFETLLRRMREVTSVFGPASHVLGDVLDITPSKQQREFEQAIVAEGIDPVLSRTQGRLLHVATVAVHRAGKIDSTIDLIVHQAANDFLDSLLCLGGQVSSFRQ